jgi:protein SCO1/2
MKPNTALLVLIGLVALAVGIFAGSRLGGKGPAPAIQGATFAEPQAIPEFRLVDHNGVPLTSNRLQGKWTFIYFGYTFCPDVCPTTLQSLGAMQRQLSEDDADSGTEYLFISVDPDRDTTDRLAQYTPFFGDRFVGATGSDESLLALTSSLGVIYAKVEGDDPDNYLVDHTSSVLLVNPKGELQAVMSAPHTPAQLARDFLSIREYYGG